MHTSISSDYRKDIDALRGISVTLVVLFHAFPDTFMGGFIGVDVFFVISGYLITGIIYKELINGGFSFVNFYDRRIRRLFPALAVVLTSSLLAGWFFLFPDELKQLGQHSLYSAFFIQNFLLINELGYFDVSSHYKPLLHLWTLSVEEQYYFIWPFVLFFTIKYKAKPLIVASMISLASFIANIYYATDYRDEVFFHSLTRIWELGAGSCLALIQAISKKRSLMQSPSVSRASYWAGIILILISAFFLDSKFAYPYWYGLIPTAGTLLVIVARHEHNTPRLLIGLGKISYPLYLWHWVIISFTYIYIGRTPETSTLIALVIASIIISYLTMKYIESIRYSKHNIITPVLASTVLTISITGLVIHNKNGVADRGNLTYLDQLNLEFIRTAPKDKDCLSYAESALGEKSGFHYCKSNSLDDETIIAVIGDSHAHALFPGISEIARKNGYGTILLANSSCPPLIDFPWGKNPNALASCKENINQIYRIIRSDKRIKKVVLTTRGPVYIHGRVKGKYTKKSVEESLVTFRDPQNQTYEKFYLGLVKALAILENTPHIDESFYILENPELDFLPKEAIPRPYDKLGISTQSSEVSRAHYKLRMSRYQELTYKAGSMYSKAKVIDVAPYMCAQEKCFTFKNGNSLYADDDHFSTFGAKYIAQRIESKLF